MKLSNDIAAVITGGASGLGEATAREFAREGVKVAILDLNAERGEAVASGLGGVFCACDVTDEQSVIAALGRARAAHGPERILVNCAGIATGRKIVSRGEAHPLAEFEKVIKINLLGTFCASAQSAAGMAVLEPVTEDGERGVIINSASVAAFEGQIGQAAYSASKGGVASLTLTMARDLADKGVRVCAIAPGIFATPMMTGMPQEVQDSLARQIPFPKRLGKPEEYAMMARQIVENASLNGAVLRLDGAIRMAPK